MHNYYQNIFIKVFITFLFLAGLLFIIRSISLSNNVYRLFIYLVSLVLAIFFFIFTNLKLYNNSDVVSISLNSFRKLKFKYIIPICLFILGLGLPLLNSFFNFFPLIDSQENRTLSPKPKLTYQSMRNYPENYEKYFNDNFNFRNYLVYANAYIKIKFLKVSPLPKIIIGKNNWAFYNSDIAGDGNSVKDYQGLITYTNEQLAQIKFNIEKRRDWLAQRNIKFFLVIPPNKLPIYPEYLPDSIKKVNKQTRLDQIIEYLNKYSDFQIIDLRSSLLKAKLKYPVYYRTGTHWTEYGSFIGYTKIMERMKYYYPDIKLFLENNFNISKEIDNSRDSVFVWVNMADLFYGERVDMKLKKNTLSDEQLNQKKIPKLVFFHDSFGNKDSHGALLNYLLGMHFEKIVNQHHYSKIIDYQLVEKEQPDVVLTEITERYQEILLNDKENKEAK